MTQADPNQLEVYADLVSLYPENPTYLKRYALLLLESGQISSGTDALRMLHELYIKLGETGKADELIREYPQIGRISGSGNGTSKIAELLPKELFGKLWLKLHQEKIKEGHHLFRQGDYGDTLYLVIKGELAVYLRTAEDSVILMNLIREGDVVGEASLFDPGPRGADVVANTDSWVVKLPRKKVITALIEYPGFQAELQHLADFRRMVALLSGNPLLQKLPHDLRQFMASQTKIIHYPAMRRIHKAGEKLTAVDVLIRGKACYSIHDRKSDSHILFHLKPGELVGDTSAIREASCPADLKSLSEVTMAHIPYAVFKNVVEAYPPFREALFHHAEKQREQIMRQVSVLKNRAKRSTS